MPNNNSTAPRRIGLGRPRCPSTFQRPNSQAPLSSFCRSRFPSHAGCTTANLTITQVPAARERVVIARPWIVLVDVNVRRSKLAPLSPDHFVDAKVPFQRIDPRHIVVVVVSISPYRPAALVEFASHSLDGDGQIDVHKTGFAGHAEIEEPVGPFRRYLGEHLGTLGSRRV